MAKARSRAWTNFIQPKTISEMDVIERLRFKNEELLKQLIQTHLSFIIDINCEHDFNQQKQLKKKIINTPNSTIFGANLTQEGICSVNQLIEYITKDNNIRQEGVFRKSGSTSRQLELRNLISLGITVDLEANRFTVHDCCNVLKKFISELPEPLLTESHLQLFRKISHLRQTTHSPNIANLKMKKLTAIQLLLLLIPSPNRQLLHELLNLFEKILTNCDSNKMSSSSLATIFAPHLFCPRNFTAIQLQQNLTLITDSLVFMIDNSVDIFKAPNSLLQDVNKQLENMSTNASSSSLEAVSSVYNFCVHEKDTNGEDFTAKQVAELYAYIQSMPTSGTPQKKKWIKRFNRENGKGTPLLKQKKLDSAKKLKSSIGDVFKAGQNFLFGSAVTNDSNDLTKTHKDLNKNLFKDYEKNILTEEQTYKKISPNIKDKELNINYFSSNQLKQSVDEKEECVTPLAITLDKANKRVKVSVRKVGSREPIVM